MHRRILISSLSLPTLAVARVAAAKRWRNLIREAGIRAE